jgi:hypothetical protein
MMSSNGISPNSQNHQLCKGITQLHYQVKKLIDIHKNLQSFNHSFASLLLGIQMQADCIILDEIVAIPNEQPPPIVNTEPEKEKEKDQIETIAISNESKPLKQQKSVEIQDPGVRIVKEKNDKAKRLLAYTMKKIASNVPLAIRDPSNLSEIELLVKVLVDHPHGEYLNVIYSQCQLDKHRTMQWLNLLVRTGDIVKVSRKGLLYQLNPEKYVI